MNRIDSMISWVKSVIDSKKYKYSQEGTKRWGNGYYDCSSLMISALREGAGINTYNSSNTGSMISELSKCKDLEIIPFNKVAQLIPGDILLWHISGTNGHTAMYIGCNKLAEAKSTAAGLCYSSYYASKWQYVIRIKNNFEIPEAPTDLLKFPMLKYGSKNMYVGLLQMVLKFTINSGIAIDCDFGGKTEMILKEFQRKYEVAGGPDGICGVNTWKRISIIMEQNY